MKRYLAHPFATRHTTRKWELAMERLYNVELVNPFYDAPDRTDVEMTDASRNERYEKLVPDELVARDLKQIQMADDGILAVIDGAISYGTIMEIVYAATYKKSVWLIVTNGHHDHPWLVHHADKIFTSFDEFEQELQRWAKS